MKTIDDQSLRHVYAEMSGAELGSIDPSPLTGAAQEVLFAELARHEEKIQKIDPRKYTNIHEFQGSAS